MQFKNHKISIKKYLLALLILVVVAQSIFFLLLLNHRGFYGQVDIQNVSAFYNYSSRRIEIINQQISNIRSSVSLISEKMTSIYELETAKQQINELNGEFFDKTYQNTNNDIENLLQNLLNEKTINSVFYILKSQDMQEPIGTKIEKIYLENEYDYQAQVSFNIIVDEQETAENYYVKTEQIASFYAPEQATKYGFWDINNLDESTENPTYTVPLIDQNGRFYGVVGVEISSEMFSNLNENQEQVLLFAVAKISENTIDVKVDFEETLESLQNEQIFEQNINEYQLYSAKNASLGEIFMKIDDINLYEQGSLFDDEHFSYLTVISASDLYKNSLAIQEILIFAVALTTFFGIALAIILSIHSTKKVTNLAKNVREIKSYEQILFKKTHIIEIDDLTQAIELLNVRINNASEIFYNLFESMGLDLGGFVYIESENIVKITGYISELIFQKSEITIENWNSNLTKLKEKCIDFDKKIYKYQDLYLKIVEKTSENGYLGTILDITQEMQQIISSKKKIELDDLTKLYSKVGFFEKTYQIIMENPQKVGALIFLDLDNLKFVNDNFGHDVGDLYLISASKLFAKFHDYNGIVARLSGDEFAIFLHGYDSKEQLLELILEKFEQFQPVYVDLPDKSKVKVQFSAGIAWYSESSSDVSELVKFADFAMYQAKKSNKGSIKQFDKSEYRAENN